MENMIENILNHTEKLASVVLQTLKIHPLN